MSHWDKPEQYCIYMDRETFHELKCEVHGTYGEVSSPAYEFIQGDSLFGVPVFPVIPSRDKDGYTRSHISFRIIGEIVK